MNSSRCVIRVGAILFLIFDFLKKAIDESGENRGKIGGKSGEPIFACAFSPLYKGDREGSDELKL